MPTAAQWSRAFAREARADLAGYQFACVNRSVLACHRFQLLQMACEKLAKSHLCAAGSDPQLVQASHAYTAKVLPLVVRDEIALLGPDPAARLAWVDRRVRPLVREIELLSPSVTDGGNRAANCEHPRADGVGRLHVPADDTFPNLSALDDRLGTVVLKLLQAAIDRLAR